MLIQLKHYSMIFMVKLMPMVIVYQKDTSKRRIMREIIKSQTLTSTPVIHGGMTI